MSIVIEAAVEGERLLQRILPAVPERRVTDVMREAERLGQILVQPQHTRDGTADLRDFEAVREAHAIMIAIGRDEHLRLVAEAPETDRMDDPVAIRWKISRGPRGSPPASAWRRPRLRAGWQA